MMRPPRRFRRITFVVAVVLLVLAAGFLLRPVEFYLAWDRVVLWFRGFDSAYLDIDGHRIHYYEGGVDGEPLVLVHGLGGRASNWQPLMSGLARKYHVLSLDLLGFGLSDKPRDGDYSIAAQSRLLGHFLDKKNLSQFYLAGWSMGGWISLDFTTRYPDRVRKLMLLSSAGMFFEPDFDPRILHPDSREELLQMIRVLPAPVPPRFVQRDLLRSMKEQHWVIERALNEMLTGRDALDGRLAGVTMPVLLVWGADDILTPMRVAQTMLAEMPQAKLVTLEGCGHLAPVLCSSQVLPVMQQFLAASIQ
jgi:pimeloyl-ACP methyl ester carboxylesterase